MSVMDGYPDVELKAAREVDEGSHHHPLLQGQALLAHSIPVPCTKRSSDGTVYRVQMPSFTDVCPHFCTFSGAMATAAAAANTIVSNFETCLQTILSVVDN